MGISGEEPYRSLLPQKKEEKPFPSHLDKNTPQHEKSRALLYVPFPFILLILQ